MPIINLNQMRQNESSRNFDDTVDANTLVSAENSQGTFGAFKFFQGIKAFFKGISALGTLTTTSRIPVTDSNGNVTYTTPVTLTELGNSNFITETSTSLNTLDIGNKKNKMFYVSGIGGGVYNGSDFCLIASKYNDSYQMQMAFSYGQNTKIKERKCINGNWTEWKDQIEYSYEDVQISFSSTGVTCELINNTEHFLAWTIPVDRYIQYVSIPVPSSAYSFEVSYWTQIEAIPNIVFDSNMAMFCVSVPKTTPITKGYIKLRFYKK